MGIFHQDTKVTGDRGYASEWNKDHIVQGAFDFRHYAALNMIIENRTDWPAGPVEGQAIYRADEHTFYVWNGTSWIPLGPVGTVVVAADGSGQFTDIQDGIDALPAAGGVVYVKEGTYTITVALTFAVNNTAVIGSGKGTKIVAGGACPPGGVFYISNRSGIIIRDLWIDADNQCNFGVFFSNVDESYITGLWIENTVASGIAMAGTTHDISISTCYIHDCGADGINALNSNIRISDCSIYSNAGDGIEFANADNSLIMGNFIHTNGANGINVWGGSDDNTISNNRVYNNVADDILIFFNTEDRNTVIGNNVHGAGGGIVDAGTNTIVEHNQA